MINFMLRLYKILRNLIFANRRTRRFRFNLSMAPNKMDTSLRRMALRYLCHHIEKAIKHDFNPNRERGKDKYARAFAIFDTLKNTKWVDEPDVKWVGQILERYRIWRSGRRKNFVILGINGEEMVSFSDRSFKDIIYTRRSIRFWREKKISREIIYKIIEMGTMAPSSCNRQPWKFVVVENILKNTKDGGFSNKRIIFKAPYIIYIAIDNRLYSEKYGSALDAGFAAQNILLAIEYFGLKSCAMYQCETIQQKKMKDILGLPHYFYIYIAIPFGFPAEIAEVPERVRSEDVTNYINLDAKEIVLYM